MRRVKSLHLFWKRITLFNMLISNIHVSLCSINLYFENGPGKKCIWKRICQIHQIRRIKYKYKYKYMVWNLIKYKYKYAVFVFVFVFANTDTYLTPALLGAGASNIAQMFTLGTISPWHNNCCREFSWQYQRPLNGLVIGFRVISLSWHDKLVAHHYDAPLYHSRVQVPILVILSNLVIISKFGDLGCL